MAFPAHFLDELTVKTDMVSLVSQYAQLVKRGSGWVARCPFHSEKTPSFHLSPEKGAFYCFGCQAGGSAIQFAMRAENLGFADAVRFLAARAGIEVPEEDGERGIRVKRERLIEINRMAARWFYERLGAPEGKRCAEYMRNRGMSPAFARRFGLGYAPESWDGLSSALTAAGVSADEMTAAGLVSRGQRGNLYDAFRGRLMFPIFDLRGQVIAFSGRDLSGEAQAKYKNSAETPIYRKRDVLYAAHLARKSEKPYWILCEGNADVFMLHQAGFDNAVAACGTALTDTQARVVSRHVKELVLAYDADEAGKTAARKASGVLDPAGVKVRVVNLRGAKDPDEFIRAYGAAAFEKLIDDSQGHTEYRLSLLADGHPLDSDADKLSYLREAAALLADLPTESERSVYAVRVAKQLGIDPKAVQKDVESAAKRRRRSAEKTFSAGIVRPRRGETPERVVEEKALSVLLRLPELDTVLTSDDFQRPDTKALFGMRGTPLPLLPEEAASLYVRLTFEGEDTPRPTEAELRDYERAMRKNKKLWEYIEEDTSKEEGDGLDG